MNVAGGILGYCGSGDFGSGKVALLTLFWLLCSLSSRLPAVLRVGSGPAQLEITGSLSVLRLYRLGFFSSKESFHFIFGIICAFDFTFHLM